ncbi:hypothetical protein ONZ45_g8985 [Pleurotus djamor]|nr:hypothetical protein ONZ45_g8985 [Pleurotus djamor]
MSRLFLSILALSSSSHISGIQHLPQAYKHPVTVNKSHAARVNQIAAPISAFPFPSIPSIPFFTRKNNTKSKMKASIAMADANPETSALQHVIPNVGKCARNPNIADMAERLKPMMWRTRT